MFARNESRAWLAASQSKIKKVKNKRSHLLDMTPCLSPLVAVLVKARANIERPSVSPMDNGGLAVAFEHGSDAAEVGHCFYALKKFAQSPEKKSLIIATG